MTLTATRRTAPPTRCPNCGGPGGTAATRFLCGPCYADGPTRSCFDPRGRRVAEQPVERVEANEYVELPITIQDPDFEQRHPAGPKPPRQRPRRRPTPTDPAARLAQQQADDAALLAAVEEVTRRARHLIAGTCVPAAGTRAAGLLAQLPAKAVEAAVARLVEAGRVRRVTVVVCAEGRDGGRLAAGLRRVTGQ